MIGSGLGNVKTCPPIMMQAATICPELQVQTMATSKDGIDMSTLWSRIVCAYWFPDSFSMRYLL